MRRIFSVLLLLSAAILFAEDDADTSAANPAAADTAPAVNIQSVKQPLAFSLAPSADYVGNLYIQAWSQLPSVLTFVSADGTVSVCVDARRFRTEPNTITFVIGIENDETLVYEYSPSLELKRIVKIPPAQETLGAFTKDADGNFYFFYGAPVKGAEKNKQNMTMIKCDAEGKKLLTYNLKAYPPDSMHGIRVPFDAGTCRLELSGNMLAVYFAREMFSGHQASYGFILDKDTFERIDSGAQTYSGNGTKNEIPYVSHSFNQFLLPIENGFIFADHGDAHPRAFTFANFIRDADEVTRMHTLKFAGAVGSNPTYAQMGGLAKTPTGYMFAGTNGGNRNSSRNVFILNFPADFSTWYKPVYLTSYKKDAHAAHPKIVQIENNRYLVLWEKCSFSTQSANVLVYGPTGYLSTYMLVIDEYGNKLSEEVELPGVRLNLNDTLRYNPVSKKAYWAINETADGTDTIVVYALEPPEVKAPN